MSNSWDPVFKYKCPQYKYHEQKAVSQIENIISNVSNITLHQIIFRNPLCKKILKLIFQKGKQKYNI